jgi:hypothetical protein
MKTGFARTSFCILVMLAVAGSSIGGPIAMQASQETAERHQLSDGVPRAVIPFTSFDFGDVYRGEVISQIFVVKNAGNADLVITDLIPTCSCEVTSSDRLIPPGKEGRAVIEVNTSTQSGPISRAVTLKTNDPNLPGVNLTLVANVLTGSNGGPVENVRLREGKHLGPLFVSPQTRWGFHAAIGKSVRFEFLVSVEKGSVNLEKAVTESRQIACHIETVQPGKQFKVVVESIPVDKASRLDNTISVFTDSPQLPWFPLQLILFVSAGP